MMSRLRNTANKIRFSEALSDTESKRDREEAFGRTGWISRLGDAVVASVRSKAAKNSIRIMVRPIPCHVTHSASVPSVPKIQKLS